MENGARWSDRVADWKVRSKVGTFRSPEQTAAGVKHVFWAQLDPKSCNFSGIHCGLFQFHNSILFVFLFIIFLVAHLIICGDRYRRRWGTHEKGGAGGYVLQK